MQHCRRSAHRPRLTDKISFVLDRTPMFSITSEHHRKKKHEVKALEIIWKRFPTHFGPRECRVSASVAPFSVLSHNCRQHDPY